MKDIRWNPIKNEQLKKARGISFEQILKEKLVAVLKHPARENQNIMLFEYKNYIWIVPYIEEPEYLFLKTIFPSRKYTQIYKEKKHGRS